MFSRGQPYLLSGIPAHGALALQKRSNWAPALVNRPLVNWPDRIAALRRIDGYKLPEFLVASLHRFLNCRRSRACFIYRTLPMECLPSAEAALAERVIAAFGLDSFLDSRRYRGVQRRLLDQLRLLRGGNSRWERGRKKSSWVCLFVPEKAEEACTERRSPGYRQISPAQPGH